MCTTMTRLALLTAALIICAGIARAQDPTPPNPPAPKKIPTMSNDDLGAKDSSAASGESTESSLPAVGRPDAVPANWRRYSPEGCGLSISLPGKPQEIQIPNAAIPIKTYIYKDDKILVIASHAVLRMHGQLRDFAEGVIVGLRGTPGVSNMQYSIDPGDGPRLGIRATYLQNGVGLAVEGFVEEQDTDCWMVGTLYPQAGASDSLSLGRKAVMSARLDGRPCLEK